MERDPEIHWETPKLAQSESEILYRSIEEIGF